MYERRPNPLVFLSSTLRNLEIEREALFQFGQQFGPYSVWVDEKYRDLPTDRRGSGHESLDGINPFEDIDDYLSELKRSKLLVVLVGTERVGSQIRLPSGASAIATFFEMELAYAAALGRPVALVRVAGAKPEPKLAYLLDLLGRHVAVNRSGADSPKEAAEMIRGLIVDTASGKYDNLRTDARQYGALLEDRWRAREQGLFWLSKDWPQFADHKDPIDAVIADCLTDVEKVKSEGQRLARLWVAMRELMCAPYWKAEGMPWLSRWNQVLKAWNREGAWYGLHGHLELGYLAALNSLAEVSLIRRRSGGTLVDDPDWDLPFGAQASAYYALARRVNSRWLRWRGLLKALRLIRQARYRDAIGESNMLAVKGSILLELRSPLGLLDYHRVLKLRETAGVTPGAIGEAMTELGYAYSRLSFHRKGLDLLERGVDLMQQSRYTSGFVVRALYKLAEAYTRSGDAIRAEDTKRKALVLAEQTAIGAAARDYSDATWSGRR